MRRFWIGAGLAGLIAISAAAGALAATGVRKQIEVEYRDIKIDVDGEQVSTPDEPFLYVEKGRTFVPARPLAEAMGGKVGWDPNTNTVQVYTKNFATMTRDGDYTIWTMPAAGFSLRAPKDFMRFELPMTLLQLNGLSPDRSGALIVAVQPIEGLSGTGTEKANYLVATLKQTFVPEAAAVSVTEEGNSTTARGTGKYFGTDPVNFTIRVVTAGSTDWALIGLVPTPGAAAAQPIVDAVLDSFALVQ